MGLSTKFSARLSLISSRDWRSNGIDAALSLQCYSTQDMLLETETLSWNQILGLFFRFRADQRDDETADASFLHEVGVVSPRHSETLATLLYAGRGILQIPLLRHETIPCPSNPLSSRRC
jgi:hypothetical protein